MKTIKKCPICNKIAEVKSEFKLDKIHVITYECGHVRSKRIPQPKDLTLTSRDGLQPYKYQLDGAAWAIKNGMRVLFADEMGVGKTLQAFLAINSDKEEYLKVLIVCKSGLRIQMAKEAFRWCGWIMQIIDDENEYILPGMQGYIVSYDALAYSTFTNKSGKTIERGMKDPEAWMEKLGVRTVILDECQKIKNGETKRTKAVQKIGRKAEYLLPLSGTPIENNMAEYFPILNLLQPEKFPIREHYIHRWGETYWPVGGRAQKVGGIKRPAEWKEFTKDFIIRRTRAEVLPDLPSISRRFLFEELGAKVEEAYKNEFKQFQNFMNYGSSGVSAFEKQTCILAYLNKMRHLTGIAKIPGVVDFVEDFLSETDRKIVIFTHHLDVAAEVAFRITQFYPKILRLGTPINQSIVDKFWTSEYRVLQAGTLAGGEGLNLQCCSDYIQMEPEWNPQIENQAAARFPRPGQTADKISGTEFIAVGTVDEFFSELKEQKRSSFASTMDGIEVKWSESSLIQELADVLLAKGGKKWGW